MFVNKQIGKCHENISIFYKKQPTYNPQMAAGKPYKRKACDRKESIMNRTTHKTEIDNKGTRYPRSIIKIPFNNHGLFHPTQKPTELLNFLIKTYTNEGQTVLDNTFGSCSTGISCLDTNRNFIGIELDDNSFKKGFIRIKDYMQKNNLENVEIKIDQKEKTMKIKVKKEVM